MVVVGVAMMITIVIKIRVFEVDETCTADTMYSQEHR